MSRINPHGRYARHHTTRRPAHSGGQRPLQPHLDAIRSHHHSLNLAPELFLLFRPLRPQRLCVKHSCCSAHRHHRNTPKRRRPVIHHLKRPLLIRPLFPRFPFIQFRALLCVVSSPRPLNRPSHMLRNRRRQLNKLSSRPLQRKTVLILPALRIRPQRRHALPIRSLRRLPIPGPRRSIRFSRHPSLHMPTIHLRILRLPPQLHHFANQISARIAVLKLPAYPSQPVPSPHHPVIRLAIPVHSTRQTQSPRHVLRRIVRLAQNLDHPSRSSGHLRVTQLNSHRSQICKARRPWRAALCPNVTRNPPGKLPECPRHIHNHSNQPLPAN